MQHKFTDMHSNRCEATKHKQTQIQTNVNRDRVTHAGTDMHTKNGHICAHTEYMHIQTDRERHAHTQGHINRKDTKTDMHNHSQTDT
jgi:hypothetical protein